MTVKPLQSTISEETFQTELVNRALEKLGYNVQQTGEVDYNVAYTAIAAGDSTYMAVNWEPLQDDMYTAPVATRSFTVRALTSRARLRVI